MKDVMGPLLLKSTRETTQKHLSGIAVKKLALVMVASSRHTELSRATICEVESMNYGRSSMIHQ